jgi:hypothetical protein
MRKVNPFILLAALSGIVISAVVTLAAFGVTDIVHAFRTKPVSLAELKQSEVVLAHARTPAQRFAILSRQHTNKCSLAPESLETIGVQGRLQGSCCSNMNYAHYVEQIHGLSLYRRVPEIPVDPYDIPVSQAKRLIALDKKITLTSPQQTVYDNAKARAHEHGPCCCHCWRWAAFEGQAKFLIARRHYGTRQVATVWDLEDGCGGGENA